MGPEIRAVRKMLGLTQAQAATLLDVHAITWAKWESGALTPSAYKVALIQRLAAAAAHPSCPRDLAVALASSGPISVLTSLLRLGQ